MAEYEHDILILPDIHGRTFWEEAVTEMEKYDKVVFLGDYLDPYRHEGIMEDDALLNFYHIIDFAQAHQSKVILLLGNHDMHYVSEEYARIALSSRYDEDRADEYHQLFEEHRQLFSLAWETAWKDKKVLFTHAGVSQGWYQVNKRVIGEMNSENLNQLLETSEGIKTLAQIGYERGGIFRWGSMVWADVYELALYKSFPNIIQVFGHSQQHAHPLYGINWACLDCRKAFRLTTVMEHFDNR